jgi:hypothetical protein
MKLIKIYKYEMYNPKLNNAIKLLLNIIKRNILNGNIKKTSHNKYFIYCKISFL